MKMNITHKHINKQQVYSQLAWPGFYFSMLMIYILLSWMSVVNLYNPEMHVKPRETMSIIRYDIYYVLFGVVLIAMTFLIVGLVCHLKSKQWVRFGFSVLLLTILPLILLLVLASSTQNWKIADKKTIDKKTYVLIKRGYIAGLPMKLLISEPKRGWLFDTFVVYGKTDFEKIPGDIEIDSESGLLESSYEKTPSEDGVK